MAQRKPARAATAKRQGPAGKPTPGDRGPGGTPPGQPGTPRQGGKPGRPGKSIVNQRQTPWGMILTVTLVVLFAAGVIGYAVTRHSSGSSSTSYLNELGAAKQITGVAFTAEPDRKHVGGTVKYDSSPPLGGNHAGVWADCAGSVYPNPIADENAMHSFEHGAVWITYRPGLPQSEINALAALVTGQNYTFMSPYPGLTSRISVQSWGYQLSVESAADPRLPRFIATLRNSPKTTPESGASCANPSFKASPSTPGHPAES
jgi:hypothetical protein